MPTQPELARAYGRVTDRLVFSVTDAVASLWLRLPNYRDRDVAGFRRVAVPVIGAAHTRMANTTAAYVQQSAVAAGFDAERVLLPAAVVAAPRGVPTAQLLERPAVSLYTALSQGKTMTEAVSESVARLRSIVSTDLQLVRTRQSQASLAASSARFYRRVLGAGENCDLCVIASGNKYSRAELMPIHDNCRCRVEPVPDNWRRQRVTRDDLVENELPAGSEDVADVESLVAVREHGETGPTLTWKSNNFTGVNDLDVRQAEIDAIRARTAEIRAETERTRNAVELARFLRGADER